MQQRVIRVFSWELIRLTRGDKESDCGCAGIYTAPAAIELYAEVFEHAGALDKLENFASQFGPDFTVLNQSRNDYLERSEWHMAVHFEFGSETVIPVRAASLLVWCLDTRGPEPNARIRLRQPASECSGRAISHLHAGCCDIETGGFNSQTDATGNRRVVIAMNAEGYLEIEQSLFTVLSRLKGLIWKKRSEIHRHRSVSPTSDCTSREGRLPESL